MTEPKTETTLADVVRAISGMRDEIGGELRALSAEVRALSLRIDADHRLMVRHEERLRDLEQPRPKGRHAKKG